MDSGAHQGDKRIVNTQSVYLRNTQLKGSVMDFILGSIFIASLLSSLFSLTGTIYTISKSRQNERTAWVNDNLLEAINDLINTFDKQREFEEQILFRPQPAPGGKSIHHLADEDAAQRVTHRAELQTRLNRVYLLAPKPLLDATMALANLWERTIQVDPQPYRFIPFLRLQDNFMDSARKTLHGARPAAANKQPPNTCIQGPAELKDVPQS